ncbi:MAG: DUF86 domain-containing protein [Actinomycetota bacterium]
MSPRDPRQRLEDVVAAIDAIAALRFEHPHAETALQYHLIVIGEAVAGIGEDIRARHPDVPWSRIVGLRNELVHAYHRVDDEALQVLVLPGLSDLRRVCVELRDGT